MYVGSPSGTGGEGDKLTGLQTGSGLYAYIYIYIYILIKVIIMSGYSVLNFGQEYNNCCCFLLAYKAVTNLLHLAAIMFR